VGQAPDARRNGVQKENSVHLEEKEVFTKGGEGGKDTCCFPFTLEGETPAPTPDLGGTGKTFTCRGGKGRESLPVLTRYSRGSAWAAAERKREVEDFLTPASEEKRRTVLSTPELLLREKSL